MTNPSGSRLGPYEVLSQLGAGGMGEVWKARDGRLDRTVAIKVLPEELFEDVDRVSRFEREAKALAALNHPGIAAVHSFEAVEGRHILVMELVEGEGLDVRIARGAIPSDEALPIARQIAEALEAAHERGIVHRDLKPANVMVTPEGRVKVLDFGLAKALDPDAASGGAPQVTHSPTITARATAAGVILGTAAYMSPEQARGKSVDKRADIWAYGCLLYEMLTGKRVFEGETASDVLAAVLRQEIDFDALPPGTPPGIARLLRRCLKRDVQGRLHDIGDAKIEIDEAIESPAEHPAAPARPKSAGGRVLQVLPWLVAAALALVLLSTRRAPPAPGEAVHLSLNMPEGVGVDPNFAAQAQLLAISPDGRRIAFRGRSGEDRRIFLRDLSRETPESLPGTEGGEEPFFSPGGEWLGFISEGKLKKTALAGGTPVTLAPAARSRGAAWGDDGTIVFSPTVNSGLFRIPATGGEPLPLTALEAAGRERTHRWPEILPGGKTVLFTVGTEDKPGDYDESRIDAISIETGKRHVVYRGASLARYAPPGYLLLARHGDVLAVPFDVRTAEVHGTPVPVLQGVSGDPRSGVSYFDVARAGALVYATGISAQSMNDIAWFDRAGRRVPSGIPPGMYNEVALSPDGQKLAYEEGPSGGARSDVWIADLAHGGQFQLTSNGKARSPRWTPDGMGIAFAGPSGDAILRQRADGGGAAEVLWRSTQLVPITLDSFVPDGSALLFTMTGLPSRADIFLLPLSGERRARTLISTPSAETLGRISPDGRWIAYTGEYAAGQQIYVQAFPSLAGRWQVSRSGGSAPRWSRDGTELFFVSEDQMFAVPIQREPTFSPGEPRALFRVEQPASSEWSDIYDVAPDGKRFVVLVRQKDSTKTPRIDVVLNFSKRLAGEKP